MAYEATHVKDLQGRNIEICDNQARNDIASLLERIAELEALCEDSVLMDENGDFYTVTSESV